MTVELSEAKLYQIIGRRIAQARGRAKPKAISQAELASRAGLTRGSIANIERGHQHPPIETLFRLALALGTEPQVLLPSPSELGVDPSSGSRLSKEERAPLEKLGLAGSATEQWVNRVKGRSVADSEMSHD
jgi:transcriptional regulator with XRE-family HTH domain